MGDNKVERLVHLQDLDLMIREAQDPKAKSTEEEMGFAVTGLEKLKAARNRLAAQIPEKDLRRYERIQRRHERAIVPVEDRICLGCYMGLPTSATPRSPDGDELLVCENCGRILYWL